MSLRDVIVSAVKTIDVVTASLQAEVSYSPWIGQDAYGVPTYGPTVKLAAIVDQQQRERRTLSGEVVVTQAYIGLLRPLPANGAAGRIEPVDRNDKFVLPDGTTGPIVDTSGFIDKGTGKPFLSEVWIGAGTNRTAGQG